MTKNDKKFIALCTMMIGLFIEWGVQSSQGKFSLITAAAMIFVAYLMRKSIDD